MEKCSLVLSVPPKNENIIVNEGGTPVPISVWKYPEVGVLDRRTLSWSTRPAQIIFFVSIDAQYGSSFETASFPCPSLSYQTFEFTCGAVDCRIDIEGIGEQETGKLKNLRTPFQY